jgi:hypothetical protein
LANSGSDLGNDGNNPRNSRKYGNGLKDGEKLRKLEKLEGKEVKDILRDERKKNYTYIFRTTYLPHDVRQ